jgi:hypothetical protein
MKKFLTDAAVLGIGIVGGVYVAIPLFQADVSTLGGFVLTGQVSSDGPLRMPGQEMPGMMPMPTPMIEGGGNVGGYPFQPPVGFMDGPGYPPVGGNSGGMSGGAPLFDPMMNMGGQYSSEETAMPHPGVGFEGYGNDMQVLPNEGYADNAQRTGFQPDEENSVSVKKIQALEERIRELEQQLQRAQLDAQEAHSRAMNVESALNPTKQDANSWQQPLPPAMPGRGMADEATGYGMPPVAMPSAEMMHNGAPTAKPVQELAEQSAQREGGLWGFVKSLFNRY